MLFTDIEGSTRLASELGVWWPEVLEQHHTVLRGAIEEHGGFIDGVEGDAFFATFVDAAAAARAAVSAMRRLRSHRWPSAVGELKVRMGLHVGFVERSSTGYQGLEVHRAARVAAAAHGGQLLITGAARPLVGDAVVVEPLGLHRFKDFSVAEPLFCAVVDGRGAASFPPPRSEMVRPTNLPAGIPQLIGREAELQYLRDAFLVDGERLVTLTGRGGAGKTMLALVSASGLLNDFPGGVWLVPLASVTFPEEVVTSVATVLGAVRDIERSPESAITARLLGRGKSLVILDNFEHLLRAAPSIASLLDAAPELSLLVTSQAPLRLGAERCLLIDALDEDAAVALIEHAARKRAAPIETGVEQRNAMTEIVSTLDGLPLALELAAARLSLLTPVQLRDRLRDSTQLLRDDRRDRPDRQHSLRATVSWALGPLDQAPRELFSRMGVFAGPVELKEIEVITSADGLDVLSALSELLDVALVRRVESGDYRIRFGLPEALRQIASEMLDSSPAGRRWRQAHLVRQHQLLWSARNLIGRESAYRAAIAADLESAAALRWAHANNHPLAESLAAARAQLLAGKGRLREALSLVKPLMASPPDDREVLGQAHLAHARLLRVLGRSDDALAAGDAAIALVSEPSSRASALIIRGIQQLIDGRFEAALADHQRATAIARGLGDAELACALAFESQARMDNGQPELASEMLAEAERIGPSADARGHWPWHTLRGDLAVLRKRPTEALEHYARSLELAQQQGEEMQMYLDLTGIADAMAMGGRDEDALEVAGMAQAQITELGADRAVEWYIQGHDHLQEAAERIGSRTAEQQRSRGRAVTVANRVARACTLAHTPQPTGETRSPGPTPASRGTLLSPELTGPEAPA